MLNQELALAQVMQGARPHTEKERELLLARFEIASEVSWVSDSLYNIWESDDSPTPALHHCIVEDDEVFLSPRADNGEFVEYLPLLKVVTEHCRIAPAR